MIKNKDLYPMFTEEDFETYRYTVAWPFSDSLTASDDVKVIEWLLANVGYAVGDSDIEPGVEPQWIYFSGQYPMLGFRNEADAIALTLTWRLS